MKFILIWVMFFGAPEVEYGEFDSYRACTTTGEALQQGHSEARFWCISKDMRVNN